MEFHQNIFNSFQVTELTQNYIIASSLKLSKGNNSKNKQATATVLVHDTSSHCALLMYEVTAK